MSSNNGAVVWYCGKGVQFEHLNGHKVLPYDRIDLREVACFDPESGIIILRSGVAIRLVVINENDSRAILDDFREYVHVILQRPQTDPVVYIEDYTCHECGAVKDCEFAYDWYNTNGDCLQMK